MMFCQKQRQPKYRCDTNSSNRNGDPKHSGLRREQQWTQWTSRNLKLDPTC